MSLIYIKLFLELLEITKKITINTVSTELKQDLSRTTDVILNDTIYYLNYCIEHKYNLNEEKKNFLLSKIKAHQERLNTFIEQFAPTKICTKCGKEFLATGRYFYKDNKARDGLRNDCKQCHKKIQKELYYNQKGISKNQIKPDTNYPLN
ncbi:MAG: hypothetical protein ACFFA3_19790 [Promethearchaeota archaeon]